MLILERSKAFEMVVFIPHCGSSVSVLFALMYILSE